MPYGRFLKNLLLWFIPVVAVWLLLTPIYNRFLTRATENLVKLTESPNHTSLRTHDDHHFLIYRDDVRGQTSTGHVGSVRVTDTQFPLLFLSVLFLAVPGIPFKQRAQALGWALLIAVFFHIVSLLFWVKFFYATQLGSWSAQNYGAFGQNFWGLGKHLLDLPFKFALPLILWCAFFFEQLTGAREREAT